MNRPFALAFAVAMISLTPAAHAANTAFGPSQKTLRANNANPHPGASYQGQVYVTPGGCSYSRAQVPGSKPTGKGECIPGAGTPGSCLLGHRAAVCGVESR